ncbi:hypothetical protein ES707_21976 [subsurface metagenome]
MITNTSSSGKDNLGGSIQVGATQIQNRRRQRDPLVVDGLKITCLIAVGKVDTSKG